jgi:hypothetical protein
MRIIHTAPTLLTPYQQKQKDEALLFVVSTLASDPMLSIEIDTNTPAVELPALEMPSAIAQPVVAQQPAVAVQPAVTEVSVSSPPAIRAGVAIVNVLSPAAEELKLLDAIYKIEQERLALEKEEQEVADELKRLRDELGEANETRAMLLKTLPEALIRIRDGETADRVVADTREIAKESLKPVVLQWHERPTREIATGISGLGPGKLDKLCDACPTIGDLNNFRVAAHQLRTHFADRLPQGIGKSIANELEKRIIEAETNYDTPPAHEQVKMNGATTEVRDVITPGRDPHVRLVTSIERSLRATATEPKSLDCKDQTRWKMGFEAHSQGKETLACPKFEAEGDEKNPNITDWLKGWLSAESARMAIADAPTVFADAPNTACDLPADVVETPSNEAPSNEATQTSVACDRESQLESFAEQLKSDGDLQQQFADKPHWGEGYATAIDELPMESCPANIAINEQRDWIRGWIHGNSFTSEL